jgi:hypothetical protein
MKYNKPTGKRELRQIHEKNVEPEGAENSVSSNSASFNATDTYTKTEGEREPQLFVLYVEGDNKEPNYFKLMQGKHAFSGLKITYMPLANCAEYKGNLAQKMCKIVAESYDKEYLTIDRETYSIQDIDSIYLVMDVDNLHDEIATGIKSEQRATWIVSNPCFEIWLYYAFHSSPETDFDYDKLEPSKRSSKLKTDLNIVHPGGIGSKNAFEKMDVSIKNAKQHYGLDEQGVPSLYATGMYILASDIYNIIKLSLSKRLSKQRESINRFKKENDLK